MKQDLRIKYIVVMGTKIYIHKKKQETYIYISKYEIQMISSIWMKDIVIKENENCKKKMRFILLFGD